MGTIPNQLDRKLSIIAPPAGKDADYGTSTGNWTTFADHIWCGVQDFLPKNSEAVRTGVRVGGLLTRFRIRRRPGLTAAMRVVLHGPVDRTFLIIAGPAEIEGRTMLEFVGEEFTTVGV